MDNSALDLSLDENDNQVPIFQSTPQKQKPSDLICQYCGKVYKVRHYFNIHVDAHKLQDGVTGADKDNDQSINLNGANFDNTINQSIDLNVSDISFSQLSQVNGVPFRVPAIPAPNRKRPLKGKGTSQPPKKKPHLICTYCLKGYVCSRSFKTHVRTHMMQEAAARLPDTAQMLEHSEELGMKALIKVSNEPCFGQSSNEFRQLVGYVVSVSISQDWKKFSHAICTEMVKSVDKKKCLLPSALINNLMKCQENILSAFDLSDGFLDIIGLIGKFSENVCAQFFLKFVLYFTTELLQCISQTFRNNIPRRRVVNEVRDPDKDERQVIYYIGGSIVRGYLKIGRRFPDSKLWQEVVFALNTKVLVQKAEGELVPDAQWTSSVDRGGLLFINSPTQNFLVKICKVVYSCEQKDGSIDYEAVIKEICNSQLSVDWDNIISDSLSETVSFNLMCDMIKSFCRTCGRGIAKKRLNLMRSRPIASMNIRHLAASRKNSVEGHDKVSLQRISHCV